MVVVLLTVGKRIAFILVPQLIAPRACHRDLPSRIVGIVPLVSEIGRAKFVHIHRNWTI